MNEGGGGWAEKGEGRDVRAAKIPFKCQRNKSEITNNFRVGFVIKGLSEKIKQLSLFMPPSFF